MTTEKKICCGIMFCQMSSILSGVALLYLAAIVIIPSKNELEEGFHRTPVMCTTVHAEDTAKLGKKKSKNCDWSTCMEWCLSKGGGICMQIHVMVRNNGSKVQFNDCYEIQSHNCSALDANKTTVFRCKKGECLNLNGLYNCSKQDTNDCVDISPAFECSSKLSDLGIRCTEEKCESRLEGVYRCKMGLCYHYTEIEKYWRDCKRKCTDLRLNDNNVLIFSKERLLVSECTSMNSTGNNTINEVSEMQDWKHKKKMLTIFCTKIDITNGNRAYNMYGEDCFNATLGDASLIENMTSFLEVLDYQRELNEISEQKNSWIIDHERSLQIMNDTRLYINLEKCVNTLRKECDQFFKTHAHDGRDGITPDRFPCYYTDSTTDYVVGKYEPEFTRILLLLACVVPGCSFVLSCTCLFLCSKAVGVDDDGHLKVNLLTNSNNGGNAREL